MFGSFVSLFVLLCDEIVMLLKLALRSGGDGDQERERKRERWYVELQKVNGLDETMGAALEQQKREGRK